MSGLGGVLRRLVHGVSMDRTERIQAVRDEIVETAATNGWNWASVAERATAARDRVDGGQPPASDDEIGAYLRSVCERCDSEGYPSEDVRDALDAAAAAASARQRTG